MTLYFDSVSFYAGVEISQTPTPTPPVSPPNPNITGDANGDGLVNGVDYVIWLNNYRVTTSEGPSKGDFNSNGVVDGVDYVIWLNNYSN
jgi:hypothetical protein